jgi:uncharacterized protein (TIGR02246 family)
MSTEGTASRLADIEDVRRLILLTWASIDRHDWDGYAAGFAEDGVFEILGQRRHGRAEIVAGPARDLAKYAHLQHLIMNEVIDVDGDEARGQWYAIAVHVPDAANPAAHADVGLHYTFSARRESDGWQFSEVILRPVWMSGLPFEIPDH